MDSFEDLYSAVVEVHARLSEAKPSRRHKMGDDHDFDEAAAPPPFKAADRASAGMPALKSRTGATPPPIPKPKPKVLAQGPKKAVVATAAPKGDKSLGIKRGFSMHTAAGAKSEPHAAQAIGWAKDKVAQRAAKGESLSQLASACREVLG